MPLKLTHLVEELIKAKKKLVGKDKKPMKNKASGAAGGVNKRVNNKSNKPAGTTTSAVSKEGSGRSRVSTAVTSAAAAGPSKKKKALAGKKLVAKRAHAKASDIRIVINNPSAVKAKKAAAKGSRY